MLSQFIYKMCTEILLVMQNFLLCDSFGHFWGMLPSESSLICYLEERITCVEFSIKGKGVTLKIGKIYHAGYI